MTLKKFLIVLVIVLPALLYPPFISVSYISAETRVFFILFSLLIILASKIILTPALIFALLIFALHILVATVMTGFSLEGIRRSLGYAVTLVFLFGSAIYFSTLASRYERLKSYYVSIVNLSVISSAFAIAYFYTLGQFNIFGVSHEVYPYMVTPFGILLEKNILGTTVVRSFFYFIEPSYAGVFYAINIIVVAPLLGDRSRIFRVVNVVGGALTFSLTFWVIVLLLPLFLKVKADLKTLVLFLVLVIALQQAGYNIDQFYADTSAGGRSSRLDNFESLFFSADWNKIWFGHGFIHATGFETAFSAGLLDSLHQTGIFGTVTLIIVFLIVFKSYQNVIVFLIISLAISPLGMLLLYLPFIIGMAAPRTDRPSPEGFGRGPLSRSAFFETGR
jgi:hypothetical protein